MPKSKEMKWEKSQVSSSGALSPYLLSFSSLLLAINSSSYLLLFQRTLSVFPSGFFRFWRLTSRLNNPILTFKNVPIIFPITNGFHVKSHQRYAVFQDPSAAWLPSIQSICWNASGIEEQLVPQQRYVLWSSVWNTSLPDVHLLMN